MATCRTGVKMKNTELVRYMEEFRKKELRNSYIQRESSNVLVWSSGVKFPKRTYVYERMAWQNRLCFLKRTSENFLKLVYVYKSIAWYDQGSCVLCVGVVKSLRNWRTCMKRVMTVEEASVVCKYQNPLPNILIFGTRYSLSTLPPPPTADLAWRYT